MKDNKDSKTASISGVDRKLKDAFEKHCQRTGLQKGRAIDGALKMFLELEPAKQLELIAKAQPQ